MRICSQCGKELEETVRFCPYCGVPVTDEMSVSAEQPEESEMTASAEQPEESETTVSAEQPEESEMTASTEQEDKAALEQALAAAKAAGERARMEKELGTDAQESQEDKDEDDIPKSRLPIVIGITVIVGLLVIAGVVLALYSSSKNDYTAAVESYLQGYEQKDVNKIISSYPEFIQDKITADTTPEEIWNNLDSTFSESLGDDWKATYTLGESTEISSADLETIASDLKDTYETDVTITKGYWVAANLKLSGSGNSTTMPLVFAVAQIDNKWGVVYQTTQSTSSSGSSDATTAQ